MGVLSGMDIERIKSEALTAISSMLTSVSNTVSSISSTVSSISSKVTSTASQVSTVDSKVTAISGGMQTFTSNGTFVVPSNVKKILVTACAGGQGGWGYQDISRGGIGGEWVVKQPFAVTSGQSINITVGTGGTGTNSSETSGQKSGGNTIIGTLLTLLGGGISGNKTGGIGERSSNDSYAFPATNGYSSCGVHYSGSGKNAAGGGSLGRGGSYVGNSVDVLPAGYGGGGAGIADKTPFNGGNGIVIIEW